MNGKIEILSKVINDIKNSKIFYNSNGMFRTKNDNYKNNKKNFPHF